MLSSEQVIPGISLSLPLCLLHKPSRSAPSPHPSILTVGNNNGVPHRATNATPSTLFALARPSLPDCFLFRALCLVLCFRESPRGNDKQMSAALYNVYARRHGDATRRSAFLTPTHGQRFQPCILIFPSYKETSLSP